MDYIIELSFSLGLFVNAILFIPQAMKLVKNKNSKEISFVTFFGFWLIQLSTVLYGILKKDDLLIYGTLLSMATCGYVIWLILYYRLNNKSSREK